MRHTREGIERKAARWLRQGISPRRLAFTLAVGFTIGCVPLVGLPTVVCAGLALALGLNLPAIQAANYAAMPFQLALIAPFVKLGSRAATHFIVPPAHAIHAPWFQFVLHMGGMAGQAMIGWLLVAAPAAVLLTAGLTLMLRRVPAIAGRAESL